MSVQNKTMAIKAKVANHIRKALYVELAQAYSPKRIQSILSELKDSHKVKIFDEFFPLVAEMHHELRAYKQKRKYKKKVHEERVKRGYNFKKKTTKEQYLASKKDLRISNIA